MANFQQMPRFDIDKDAPKLSKVQLDYMKQIEKQNLLRAQKLAKQKTNNRITALALGVGVIGIYAYSILAVKQENFLDELEK